MAFYSPKVGGLANYISYTPYMNAETGTPHLNEKGEAIMLQEYLEKKWGKDPGYYTNRAPRRETHLKRNDLTYFQTQSWIMNDGCTVLDMANEDEEIGYYVMLASHLVANSEREWKEHKWPRAQWYIALENESDSLKYKKNAVKTQAIGALTNSDFTDIYKRKVVSLLEISSSKSNLTTEQVANALYEYIDKSAFTPGSNIDKFLEVYSLIATPHGREQLEARWILKQALDNRIIYERQDTYSWVRPKGTIVIGERYSEAVDYILNPKKSVEVDELLAEIKAKQS